jgi:myo-inositol-1(or 4)-monophosphatase
MNPAQAERLAADALGVARRAAAHALSGFRKPMRVEHKGAIDLVTSFDTTTEHIVREALGHLTPGIPVMAEEEGGSESGAQVWYVDPIDGTTNYAHGHPFWCVSIGLLQEGNPVAGAVVAPALQLEWVGWHAGNALRNEARCRVSEATELSESLLATGFPYDRQTSEDNNFVPFIALKRIVQGIRRCGSAAIDLCCVADGTYDGYWERKLKPWDIAAGAAIVLAAGGQVTAFDGSRPDVRSGNLVATNGRIHAALLGELRKVRKGLDAR